MGKRVRRCFAPKLKIRGCSWPGADIPIFKYYSSSATYLGLALKLAPSLSSRPVSFRPERFLIYSVHRCDYVTWSDSVSMALVK